MIDCKAVYASPGDVVSTRNAELDGAQVVHVYSMHSIRDVGLATVTMPQRVFNMLSIRDVDLATVTMPQCPCRHARCKRVAALHPM